MNCVLLGAKETIIALVMVPTNMFVYQRKYPLYKIKILSVSSLDLYIVLLARILERFTHGDNDEGQLGDASTNAVQRPRLVNALQVINKNTSIQSSVWFHT